MKRENKEVVYKVEKAKKCRKCRKGRENQKNLRKQNRNWMREKPTPLGVGWITESFWIKKGQEDIVFSENNQIRQNEEDAKQVFCMEENDEYNRTFCTRENK